MIDTWWRTRHIPVKEVIKYSPLAASTGPVVPLWLVPATDAILTRYVTVELRLVISWLLVLPSLTDTLVPVVSPAPAK